MSTDRLGLTAMRCAGLIGRLEDGSVDVDRAGYDKEVEVYPGASLRVWGFDTTGYRSDASSRERLIRDIKVAAPWLDLAAHEKLMIASADACDAVIASLAAQNATLGLYEPPPLSLRDRARREGWIALPIGTITELFDPSCSVAAR